MVFKLLACHSRFGKKSSIKCKMSSIKYIYMYRFITHY
jgi:hypothetical protein